jgi:anti-anti-sigma factor
MIIIMDHHYSFYEFQGLLVIEVKVEKFDFFEISVSSAYLRNEIEKRVYPAIIFDFSRVFYIDSSAFGFLFDLRNSIKKKSYEIAIVCTNKEVLHVMQLLMVHKVIKIFDTREAAAEYLSDTKNE